MVRSTQSSLPRIFGSLLIGLAVFWLVVGPAILDPTYISWIGDGDPMQQYLGWEFFRSSAWEFPIGLNSRYGIDLGASIVYSDSIPLLAIFFKAIAILLPEPFQYFGWWTLICFLLQAIFAGLLARLITRNWILEFLVTGLLTFSMPMFWRLGFHHYLLSQFLILAAIYLNFAPRISKSALKWMLLLSIAVLINFYIFVMIFMLWVADLLDRHKLKQSTSASTLFEVLITLGLIFLLVWQAGYFAVGGSSSFATGMYGESRLNLITLFDANGWSWVIKALFPKLTYYAGNNYESFHFLGTGLIFVFLFSISKIKNLKFSLHKLYQQYFFLMIISVALCCFAVTNWVSFGAFSIHLPIPDFLYRLASILRSSGRLFLPVYYLIVLVVLYLVIRGFKSRQAVAILSIALLVQIFDSAPAWIAKRQVLAQGWSSSNARKLSTPLVNPFWAASSMRYQKIVTIFEPPSRGVIPENWSPFAGFAALHHLDTNSAYLARYDDTKLAAANAKYEAAIASGKYDPNTLYIIGDERVMPVLMHLDAKKDLFAKIDGFNVLAPGWAACTDCIQPPKESLIMKTYPKIKMGESIGFGKGQIGAAFLIGVDQRQIKGWGWGYPESWGVWSEGPKAKVVLPIPAGKPKTLTMDFRAFITAAHPKQSVEVLVNNAPYQTIIFNQDQNNQITINLPQDTNLDYIAIELRLLDAKSPKELDIGDDIRPLGVGLTWAEFRH